jgi:flagellin
MKDMDKLLDQLNNIASQTNYNGITLLQASAQSRDSAASLTFQMGETANDTISSTAGVMSNTSGLTLTSLKNAINGQSGADFSAASARGFMTKIDSALNQMNSWRSDFGSTQNQLESALRNMATQQTNIKAAESVIRDVDYAAESANFNKQNIIAQAGTYAISQANAVQQNVLRLLQ